MTRSEYIKAHRTEARRDRILWNRRDPGHHDYGYLGYIDRNGDSHFHTRVKTKAHRVSWHRVAKDIYRYENTPRRSRANWSNALWFPRMTP